MKFLKVVLENGCINHHPLVWYGKKKGIITEMEIKKNTMKVRK